MVSRASPASIAFVGAGPTTIYTLCAFLKAVSGPASVTIYEEQPRAGLGTPYRPGWNDPAMLSNIASIEIPEIEDTLIDWLAAQPRARLIRLGIDPEAIDDRTFYPRIALGEYFLDQFNALIAHGARHGVRVTVATSNRVTDIRAVGDGLCLSITPTNGDPFERRHDHVVLATGHQWPEEPEVRPGFFASPWPATALHRIPATRVGIRGSSLTAIDAAVAVAVAHGSFIESEGTCVDFRRNPGSEALMLTMMSRKGLLPEADFHHPVPYEPLAICTEPAIARLIAERCETLLDDAYALFKRELATADPAYADEIGLADLSLDNFADAYFAARIAADPFEWAEANLAEARANIAARVTVPWRYAILRMHEVIAAIVPHLTTEALDRFDRYWKPIFVDDYATVPHLSIERLLALHRADCLDVIALGEDYRVDTHGDAPGAVVTIGGKRAHFPAFVDATGQRPLAVEDFPFATLLEQGVVRDVASVEDQAGDAKPPKGIAIDESFHPVSTHPAAARLYCLSIPFILGRHPFIQGITSSHEMGRIVGDALAGAVHAGADEPSISRHKAPRRMKLFAIYIGGEHPAAHIEVHDIRFVVAPTIKDTYATLRADWWGTPGTLHVDCWAEIDHADGWDVTLRPEPSKAREKLWFVNLGGYDAKDFAEQHRNLFVVAATVSEAKARALETIANWKDAHRDDLYEAEHAFALDRCVGERLYVHLSRSDAARPPRFTCRYTPLK